VSPSPMMWRRTRRWTFRIMRPSNPGIASGMFAITSSARRRCIAILLIPIPIIAMIRTMHRFLHQNPLLFNPLSRLIPLWHFRFAIEIEFLSRFADMFAPIAHFWYFLGQCTAAACAAWFFQFTFAPLLFSAALPLSISLALPRTWPVSFRG
jgi:hypothetical protein